MIRLSIPPRLYALMGAASIMVLVATAVFATCANASTTVRFGTSGNGYVRADQPTTNFSTDTVLRIDGSPIVRAYLRFDLRGVVGSITSARLQIWANTANTAGYTVERTGNAWTQASLTYQNAPAVGASVASVGGFAAGSMTTADVTSAVTGGSLANFVLVDRNATAVSLASAADPIAAHRPSLVLTVGGTSASSGAAPTATAPATAQPSASASTSGSTTPPAAGSPRLIGAGDICITSIMANAAATAKLVEARPSDVVYTLGDNSNEAGTLSEYTGCYGKTWGAFLNRTHATIGNHDCGTSNCGPYYQYFGADAGPAGKGYYSYDLANNWHVIVLNSQGSQVGGVGVGSPQETWLRADLAANAGKHIIAMWHIPVFTSGQLSRNAYLPFWQDLYNAHADIIMSGHDHLYERTALMNASGKADPNGIRQFTVGTGGASPQPFGSTVLSTSQVRQTGTFGVLELTLGAHSYSWQFIPVAGKTFTDSGTQATHS